MRTSSDEIDALAQLYGFKRKGERNWVRRTTDFVQLINLQHSQWDAEDHYLNFALWPLAFGDPPSIAESKFHFRTRAEAIGATDVAGLFTRADALTSLSELSAAKASGDLSGLMTLQLQELLRLP